MFLFCPAPEAQFNTGGFFKWAVLRITSHTGNPIPEGGEGRDGVIADATQIAVAVIEPDRDARGAGLRVLYVEG